MNYRKIGIIALLLYCMIMPNVMADLTGGGEVTNSAPQVISFTITPYANVGDETNYQTSGGNPTSELNDDGDDYIEVTVVVYDPNGEDDMTWINFTVDKTLDDGTAWMSHQIVAADKDSDDPGFQENSINGFDNGTQDNGYLTFKFKHTFDYGDDPSGSTQTSALYTWTVQIKDSAGSTDTDTAQTTVYNYANLICVQSYFSPSGAENSTDIWGNWSGSSGATLKSKNYLKATNDGTADGTVQVSWNAPNLTNSTNGHNISLTNMNYYEGEAVDASSVTSWTAYGSGQNSNPIVISAGSGSTITSWTNHSISIPASTPTGKYTQTFTWSKTS